MSEFHDAFAAALAGDSGPLARGWAPAADLEVRLSVYRNTIAKGGADALIAQFPTVLKLVGEPWLGAAALAFSGSHPPRQASLLTYGEDFPDWLATFPPAVGQPHLPAIARLDMLWTQAHLAADAPPLAAEALAALDGDGFARWNAELHPAVRFAAFEFGAGALWQALQADVAPAAFELDDTPQALLFVRPGLDIVHRVIGLGVVALLTACQGRASLAEAAGAALAAEPDLALAPAFAELIELGAFARLTPTETP